MVFDISYLKKIRKQLDLTQHEFAKKASISQSMVAKIESGRLDPTYSKVKKIEEALEILTRKHEKEAKDIMTTHIISTDHKEKALNIIKLMKKYSISQVPIIENNQIIGLVSESSILSKDLEDIKKLTAKDIMDDAPPIVAKNTKMEVIKQLLKYYPIILIKDGKLIGIISKADLIKSLV